MYDSQAISDTLFKLYPRSLIRGKRIRRDLGTQFGEFQLDANTAKILSFDNVGVLVHKCGKLERICQKLQQLDRSLGAGIVVAVFDRADTLRCAYGLWHEHEEDIQNLPKKIPLHWRSNKVMLATPESLKQSLQDIQQQQLSVSAMLILDWECTIHKARGHATMQNDRPQHIVDFRAAVSQRGWSPPFFIMIDRAASSVDVESLSIAFALEAFWYIDGTTLSCKPEAEN